MRSRAEIGEALKAARDRKGWSQEQVGKKIGRVKNAVKAIEKGESGSAIEVLVAFAEAVDLDLDVLVSPRGAARSDPRWILAPDEKSAEYLKKVAERLPTSTEKDRRLALDLLEPEADHSPEPEAQPAEPATPRTRGAVRAA